MTENSKITADVFSKPINSFTYVLCGTWYPSNNINNSLERLFWDSDAFATVMKSLLLVAMNLKTT